MKIIELNAGLLSNHEVAQVLRERGADPSAGLNTRATASEKTVYEYLLSQAGCIKSREELQALIDDLKPFGLARAELAQVINLAPASAVEVHLVVEDCEERLSEQQVEALTAVVARHLRGAAGRAAADGDGAMQE
eukprot:GHRQ01001245.1.p2 GENE.GHRQ01001245.1~~GHRQ01001245.1.p2  ORF type:complete len:135 (+),score=51.47 GHRQ01001245.1:196-600(+)